MISRSKIKNLTEGYSVSSDFADALNKRVKEIITNATDRAKANGRKTIMGRDV